ncbi:MAG: hypothetical protein C0514_03470 [Candidatus Puniceispirillum sp.]|nr:hypothetical protein [Candidatus Puniceispirillum sp.]
MDPALTLIEALQSLPSEAVCILSFLVVSASLFLTARFFGKSGLLIYSVLALLVGNIQVLKGISVSFWDTPIAMGTTIFSATFVISDILTQVYGKKDAFRAVLLGFWSTFLVAILMTLALGVRPLGVPVTHPDFHFDAAHEAMMVLFAPAPRLLLASLTAYLVSQALDITLFDWLKRTTPLPLVLRAAVTTALAFFVDNTVFSLLAWRLFSPTPVPWDSLFYSYIMGTYFVRVGVSILFLPLIASVCKTLSKRRLP